jgi:hypothetical protein
MNPERLNGIFTPNMVPLDDRGKRATGTEPGKGTTEPSKIWKPTPPVT